ncbi:AI-2E family transporter [Clostridium sp. LBM24168]
MEIKREKILKYISIFSAATLIIVFFMKVSIFREFMYLFIISFLITYALKPFHMKLVDEGVNKSISALILICIIVLIIVGGFLAALPYFFKGNLNVKNALNSIQDLINNIYTSLKPIKNSGIFHTFTNNIYYKLQDVIIGISGKIYDFILNLSSILIYAIIVPIIVYYFLVDGKRIEYGILNFFPIKSRSTVYKISCHIDKILGRYIVSQLILSLFVGIATFVILVLLKVNFPIILSLINAFFNIIPYFGPIFGTLPAIFIAFMNSPKTAIEVTIWLYALQQIEGNILCPKITADSISMHPLTVILLLLIGDKAAGFIGMVAAVPLGVIVKIIYEDLRYYIF